MILREAKMGVVTLYVTQLTHYMGVVTPMSHTWEWQLFMSQYENSEELG